MDCRILSVFPDLLSYGFGSYFLAPTIIRVAVASVFIYLALTHFKDKAAVSGELTMPKISRETAVLGTWVLIGAELALAFALFFGAWTQVAAILGALASIKAIILRRKFPIIYPLSPLVYALLAVMCAVLLLTGAGAFAFDLPL